MLPIYFIAIKLLGRKLRPLSVAWWESYSKMFSLVEENIGMLPAIKAFVREKLERDRFEEKNQQLLSASSKQILVAQNTLLLNGTVRDNLIYGRFDASEEDIKRAVNAARATEFIEQLPDGYDTIIGDQGVKLSGGQRQRLSLARTLMKDPPILILDEATAMFDPEGEAGFIHECRELIGERTVMLITHRPASLALADRVLKMNSNLLPG